jgi:uncharacterized membrane protein YGL010W
VLSVRASSDSHAFHTLSSKVRVRSFEISVGRGDIHCAATKEARTRLKRRELAKAHTGKDAMISHMKSSTRGTVLSVLGMASLLLGRKWLGASLFAKGVVDLERGFREANPSFQGGMGDRIRRAARFYEETHQNPTNRWLHVVGIPMIVGGAVGLFASKPFRPMWWVSAGSFATGWAANIVGHAVYERKAPAFKDDPLSFVIGPVWDMEQLWKRLRTPVATTVTVTDVEDRKDHDNRASTAGKPPVTSAAKNADGGVN